MSILATGKTITNKKSATAKSHLPAQKRLAFEKIHGLGNDFVLVDAAVLGTIFDIDATPLSAATAQTAPDDLAASLRAQLSRLAVQVCDRHKGIGADGLIVAIRAGHLVGGGSVYAQALKQFVSQYKDGGGADFSWIYINSDGSYSTMCGNGLRCLALFIARQGWTAALAQPEAFKISLSDSTVTVKIRSLTGDSTGGGADKASVSTLLAPPIFDCEQIPVVYAGASSTVTEMVDTPILLTEGTVYGTAVSMGNPHVVIFAPIRPHPGEMEWAGYPVDMRSGRTIVGEAAKSKKTSLLALSEQIQSLSLFPSGVNVEWVQVVSPSQVHVYVVERGCGPTLACASGAAAVVAAGVKQGLLKRQCCVILPGGNLDVDYLEGDMQDQIELTGDAKFVFEGEILLDSMALTGGNSVFEAGAKI